MRIVFAVEPERGSGEDGGDGESEREGGVGLVGAEEVKEWGGEAEEKERGSGDFAVVMAAREIPDQERKDDESGCRLVELDGMQRDAQRRAIPDGGDAAGVGDRPGQCGGCAEVEPAEEGSDAIDGDCKCGGGGEGVSDAKQRQAF